MVVFVDRVVCEVLILPFFLVKIKLIIHRWFVLSSCKSCEAVLVHVDPQRVYARDSDVDSEVELQAIDQERIRDVMTGDHVLASHLMYHFRILVRDNDSLALRLACWLEDPELVWFSLHMKLELLDFFWKIE